MRMRVLRLNLFSVDSHRKPPFRVFSVFRGLHQRCNDSRLGRVGRGQRISQTDHSGWMRYNPFSVRARRKRDGLGA